MRVDEHRRKPWRFELGICNLAGERRIADGDPDELANKLASIGEAAWPATGAVVQWALTLRVDCKDRLNPDENDLFLELVTLDAEYRLRVIAAVTAFGEPATPALVRLLKSQNGEKRKMAVAILGLDALTLDMLDELVA